MHTAARVGTFVAALLGGFAGVIGIFPLGLVASELIIYPLAVGVGALSAALAGGWAGTFLAADGSRTRLWPATRDAAATAIIVTALLLAYLLLAGRLLPRVLAVPPIVLAVVTDLLLAAGATIGVWRHRTTERHLGRDVRLTLALMAVAVASVPVALFVASLLGLTGA